MDIYEVPHYGPGAVIGFHIAKSENSMNKGTKNLCPQLGHGATGTRAGQGNGVSSLSHSLGSPPRQAGGSLESLLWDRTNPFPSQNHRPLEQHSQQSFLK